MATSQGTALETTQAAATTPEATWKGEEYVPLVDIFEVEDRLEIVADLPGVSTDGLQVKLEDDVLTIHGRVTFDAPKTTALLYREFEFGDFFRAFTLVGDFDRERIEAALKNGVLRVVLPKAPEARMRRIEVKAS